MHPARLSLYDDTNRISREDGFEKKSVAAAVLAAVLVWLLAGCAAGEKGTITSAEELNDSRYIIGVDQGSAADLIAEKEFPEASFAYYSDKFMGYRAVADGKLDAFIYDRRQMEIAIENGLSGVRLLDGTLAEPIDIAAGISPVSKIDRLEERINAFIAELRGTVSEMVYTPVREDGYSNCVHIVIR